MRSTTFPVVLASVALGLTLGHLSTTHGDHHRIAQLQRQTRDLQRQLDAVNDHVGVVDDRDHSEIAELYGNVHDLQERERARTRASRSRRSSAPSTQAVEWAASRDAVRVANCESADLQHWPYSDGTRYLGGEHGVHLRDPNGHDGKWQFAPSTWRSVGGSGRAYDASESEQDYRAWLLWKRDGWQQPWTCARLLGIS